MQHRSRLRGGLPLESECHNLWIFWTDSTNAKAIAGLARLGTRACVPALADTFDRTVQVACGALQIIETGYAFSMCPQQINPTGIHSSLIKNRRDVTGFAGMRVYDKYIRAFIHAETTIGIPACE